MNMNRRDAIKLGATGIIAAATATTLSGCNNSEAKPGKHEKTCNSKKKNIIAKHQVVVIGAGYGGLTVASELKKENENIDVLVIEKNQTFMSCPASNTYIGKIDDMGLDKLMFDYAKPVEKYGYEMLQAEVVDIDRGAKQVHTAQGVIEYEILILSPGIAYDYETQFPTWDKKKIAHISRVAPGALIPGGEHLALDRMLADMDDGNVIVTVPAGKYRCPPAPFERACMIATYMKKEDIRGKVIILNPSDKISKGAAFKESWKELYGDMIEHVDFATVTDVDPETKTVTYTHKEAQPVEDKLFDEPVYKTVEKKISYEVLNLIPNNKSNPVVNMADLELTDDNFHKVVMNGCSFQTKSDANVYAIGDVVAHAIPPSGQTANWAGKQCAKEVAAQLAGKKYVLPVSKTSVPAGNVCYSMVGDKPEEGILVTHDFSWNGTIIVGKGNVPKDPRSGKYRSRGTAKALRDWYRGITSDLFS